jgi:hypothetical protein
VLVNLTFPQAIRAPILGPLINFVEAYLVKERSRLLSVLRQKVKGLDTSSATFTLCTSNEGQERAVKRPSIKNATERGRNTECQGDIA